MADWLDAARESRGPIYERILRALMQAVATGELQPGDRLPPQRGVAQRLGVDLTTVTRAYSEARARGLVEGTVGRGTFVRARPEEDEAGLLDLGMILPPPPEGVSLGALLAETIDAILTRTDSAMLMSYHAGFGGPGQRAAAAAWLRPVVGEVDPGRVLVAPGAQAALAAVLSMACQAGDTVVAEPLTYPGFLAVARQRGLRLLSCPTDDAGLDPVALDALCVRERPAALYVVPTMQNPTAGVVPADRRADLAAVAARHDLTVIEDDPYSRLMDAPPPALSTFAPDRTFHIATLAKCLSPGLRVAYLLCPPGRTERAADALRATAMMAPPLMAAVATRWIREGGADRLLAAVKAEGRARRAIAAELLPQALGPAEGIHVWLPLKDTAASDRLRLAAHERGLALVTAEVFATGPGAPCGARISLGAASRRGGLRQALAALADALGAGDARSGSVV